MKKIIDLLTSRMLSLLGLNFDVELQEDLFSQISSDVFLGSHPTPEQVETLKKKGITHIVSCLDEEKRSKVAFLNADFQTLFLPVKDGIHEDISLALPTFFNFMSHSQSSSSKAKVLVHCEAGVSRSATLVLAHLMNRDRKSFFDTFKELHSKRAKVLPNIGFASQLQKFEHSYCKEKPALDRLSSLAQYLHEICNVPVEIEVLQSVLEANDYNALSAIHAVFGEDIPRVIQGVRV